MTLAKPISIGSLVRITAGKLEGQTGKVVKSYRAKWGTPAHVYVELPGMLPGWSASVPVDDVEVVE